jgi:predicted amidohydrolase YtcJ
MAQQLRIHNARIWTDADRTPWTGSVSINKNGEITALENSRPADCGFTRDETAIDAGGRTITPGLIDAHIHVLAGGLSLNHLDLSTVKSRSDFESAIEQRHQQLPPNQWLIAKGWSQENWPNRELPTKQWLAGAGDRPTVCYRMDMHAALVNDAVLQLCDLRRGPADGQIVRDERTGDPTGLMIEAAAWHIINPMIPQPSVAFRQHALLAAQRLLHSLGITAVGTMEYWRDVRDVFLPLRDQLTLRYRITLLDRDWPLDVRQALEFANDDHLAIIGYKTFIDGTLGSRTARMLQDYADDPGNRGLILELAAAGKLHEWIRRVADRGLSPSMHAIGDEAARIALDTIDSMPNELQRQCRPRIEHAQQIHLADLNRFRGRIASMQPLHKADDCRYVRQRLGESRLAGTFAFRQLANAGAVLAFGSDWPVVSPDPVLGMRCAVTGLTHDEEVFRAQENLTIEEALRAYTVGAGFALGMYAEGRGALRVGAPGDLVMFSDDPFAANWATSPPRVMMTAVGGEVVYDARAAAGSRAAARRDKSEPKVSAT